MGFSCLQSEVDALNLTICLYLYRFVPCHFNYLGIFQFLYSHPSLPGNQAIFDEILRVCLKNLSSIDSCCINTIQQAYIYVAIIHFLILNGG